MRQPAVILVSLLAISGQTVQATHWGGWRAIPGGGTTDRAVAATATSFAIYAFSKGIADKHVYFNTFRIGRKSWQGWALVPGSVPTDEAPAVVSAADGIHVFVHGSQDRHVLESVANPSASADLVDLTTTFNGWHEVPGGGTTSTTLAAASGGQRATLFMTGLDQHIYANSLA